MIKVKNLKKSFNDKLILKGINCEFEKGKTSLIIGQTGSGKTVFLKCLLGLHKYDSGEILFDKISAFYSKALNKFVKNPGETMIAVIMLLWFFGYAMYGNFNKGTLYFADVDPVAAEINVRARGNFSSQEAKSILYMIL